MTAAGAIAVTVEWQLDDGTRWSMGQCGCQPAILLCGSYAALVHESDVLRPVRCPRSFRHLDEHVRLYVGTGADRAWRTCADVVCGAGLVEPFAAVRLVPRLVRETGCLVAGVRLASGGCLVLSRDGRCLVAAGAELTPREHGWVASLWHAWAGAGVQADAGGSRRLLIRSSSRRVSLGLMEA